jgi:hypothetical protein
MWVDRQSLFKWTAALRDDRNNFTRERKRYTLSGIGSDIISQYADYVCREQVVFVLVIWKQQAIVAHFIGDFFVYSYIQASF